MQVEKVRWSYCIARPLGELEMEYSYGPIALERIRQIVGGPYTVRQLLDHTAIAYRTAQSECLLDNVHYPGLKGTVLVGKLSGDTFVGAIGICE